MSYDRTNVIKFLNFDEGTTVSDADVDTAINACTTLYGSNWAGFPDDVQEVLINIMFNVGQSAMSGADFTSFVTNINEDNYSKAGDKLMNTAWAKQSVANTGRARRCTFRLKVNRRRWVNPNSTWG